MTEDDNTALIEVSGDTQRVTVQGSSTGGGVILVTHVQGLGVNFSGASPTLILRYTYAVVAVDNAVAAFLHVRGELQEAAQVEHLVEEVEVGEHRAGFFQGVHSSHYSVLGRIVKAYYDYMKTGA